MTMSNVQRHHLVKTILLKCNVEKTYICIPKNVCSFGSNHQTRNHPRLKGGGRSGGGGEDYKATSLWLCLYSSVDTRTKCPLSLHAYLLVLSNNCNSCTSCQQLTYIGRRFGGSPSSEPEMGDSTERLCEQNYEGLSKQNSMPFSITNLNRKSKLTFLM